MLSASVGQGERGKTGEKECTEQAAVSRKKRGSEEEAKRRKEDEETGELTADPGTASCAPAQLTGP